MKLLHSFGVGSVLMLEQQCRAFESHQSVGEKCGAVCDTLSLSHSWGVCTELCRSDETSFVPIIVKPWKK